MSDLTEPCPNCGALMRWETSHERCDSCGFILPCCEGAPCPVPSHPVPTTPTNPTTAGEA